MIINVKHCFGFGAVYVLHCHANGSRTIYGVGFPESAKNSFRTFPKIGIPADIVSSDPANVRRRKFDR